MSELQIIETTLKRAARRQRWQRAIRGLWRGLLAGGLVWLLALALFKVLPFPVVILPTAAAVAGTLMLVGFVFGWWRKPSLIETARFVDGRQHLQERLSTAWELNTKPASGEWRELLVADAARLAGKIDPRKFLPFHLPRASRWALLVLALAAGLGFVPEYRSKSFLQAQREAEIIRDTGKQLSEFTKRSLEGRKPLLETTQKSLASVKELGDQMTKAKLTRSDALRDLASVTEKLKDQTKELGKDPAIQRLEQAARTPSGQSSPTSADLQKQIDNMQKSLGDKSANPEAMDKLKNDLQKLERAAAGLPGKDSAASKAVKEQIAKSLADLAKKAQDLGLSLPNLDEAIKALEAGQIDQFLKDLKTAEIDLEKMQAMAKALQQLQMELAQMGKDLAEQLEKGQATMAQSTLKKMIDQLKAADLSPEQLKKIMDEVSKAIKPGSQYAKVGDFLKQAGKQLQQGQKSDAAQSLADAAKELQRLMDEMGDAQSLMAALENLKIAQMCVGNCKSWGQCNKPGLGKGGKPGSGVGTWADDNSSDWIQYPELTDRWDNSGLKRPDQDPRGQTDRGDGQLSDALVPTKVKGQITPGGPMPSITLKGVSVKGTSKVAYEEAATAAQTEAQSALNQDQVPRAYQGAVRDYFDDLKK
ncbi:MAG: hypothetical protein HY298_18255 [Verrucomicrobia bacterium]|nr:hypothetical protein [Verrucomicrobiota bacterium]